MEWSFTISSITSQLSCKVVTTLQGCEHLAQIATTLSQPCKVVARLLPPSYFRMGILICNMIAGGGVFTNQIQNEGWVTNALTECIKGTLR